VSVSPDKHFNLLLVQLFPLLVPIFLFQLFSRYVLGAQDTHVCLPHELVKTIPSNRLSASRDSSKRFTLRHFSYDRLDYTIKGDIWDNSAKDDLPRQKIMHSSWCIKLTKKYSRKTLGKLVKY
jgi:hypothetical protein